jgi:hypothetical protein
MKNDNKIPAELKNIINGEKIDFLIINRFFWASWFNFGLILKYFLYSSLPVISVAILACLGSLGEELSGFKFLIKFCNENLFYWVFIIILPVLFFIKIILSFINFNAKTHIVGLSDKIIFFRKTFFWKYHKEIDYLFLTEMDLKRKGNDKSHIQLTDFRRGFSAKISHLVRKGIVNYFSIKKLSRKQYRLFTEIKGTDKEDELRIKVLQALLIYFLKHDYEVELGFLQHFNKEFFFCLGPEEFFVVDKIRNKLNEFNGKEDDFFRKIGIPDRGIFFLKKHVFFRNIF